MKRVLVVLLLLFWGGMVFARAWWRDAVFYEVFVRSFYDFDTNGIGDLKGLTEKLDYFNDGVPEKGKDLEVDALWLMPIFDSPSYHGYDTINYYKIDPDYGTMEDFENFLKEAHKRRIRVILDLVINHTGSGHPWFMKSAAREKGYENYYVWKDKLPDGDWQRPWGGGNASAVWHYNATRHGYYYAAFWGGMPDLNLSEPRVFEEIKKIAKFWLDKGVDGFRLDAARYLIEEGPGKEQADTAATLDFWKRFNAYVKSVKSDAMLVGEVWTGNETVSRYYEDGKGLDLCFDFTLADTLLRTARYGTAAELRRKIEAKRSFPAPFTFYAPFLSNHDQTRAMSVFGGDFKSAKLAAVLLFAQSGTPFLYYGEEIGLPNGALSGDQAKRTPMQWNKSAYNGFTKAAIPWQLPANHDEKFTVAYQNNRKNSLLSLYRRLIRIRHKNSEFRSDRIETLDTASKKVVVIKRSNEEGDVSYIIANGSKKSQPVVLPNELVDMDFMDLLSGKKKKFASGNLILPSKVYWILKKI